MNNMLDNTLNVWDGHESGEGQDGDRSRINCVPEGPPAAAEPTENCGADAPADAKHGARGGRPLIGLSAAKQGIVYAEIFGKPLSKRRR